MHLVCGDHLLMVTRADMISDLDFLSDDHNNKHIIESFSHERSILWSVNNSNSFEAKIREHFGYYSRAHKNYLLSQALLGLAEAVRFYSFMQQKSHWGLGQKISD